MALFQPTNVIPSALSGAGAGTIDATQPLTVSWQVNGNSPMVAYQIKIMYNTPESISVLDTGKVTLASPFFGTNSRGEIQLFSTVLTAQQLYDAGIRNGNEYKMSIKQWWNATDAIEQTSASFFITRAAPSLILYPISRADAFDYQEYTFTASYVQQQGDTINWTRWELQALINGTYVTVDDTGVVYGGGGTMVDGILYLYYTHNGFAIDVDENNNATSITYRVRVTVQTENGVEASTDWRELTTLMSAGSHIPATLILCPQRDTDAVKIEMPKNFPIQGMANGAYSFETQNFHKWLVLPGGSSVTFGGEGEDSLDVDTSTPYSLYCKMSITSVENPVTYLTADYGDFQLTFSYDANGFYVSKGNTRIWEYEDTAITNEYFAIAVSDSQVLFGTNKNGAIVTGEYEITPWLEGETLQSMTLSGPGIVRTLHVAPVVTMQQLTGALQSPYSFWTYTNRMQFYGRFDGTLYTGFISDQTDSLSIYRKETNGAMFDLIANFPISQRIIYDYAARNQQEYQYFFFLLRADMSIEERHGVASVTPCWWNYTVLCCEQNNVGDYIVQEEYRFALNVESGSMGNNNKPTLQNNFTQYPLRQPTSANYRSGTLSALIGENVNGQYVDSVTLMKDLYALSTNPRPKFLRTRKGEILQIDTSSPVAMQITDKYAEQPAKISFPWLEVGDATGANILGDDYFAGLPKFHVNPETMELTMAYNENSRMGVNSFTLVDADLYINDAGVYETSDFSINTDNEVVFSGE